jgi:N-acetylglutamate synthase-like GNAT family acetyltransferase
MRKKVRASATFIFFEVYYTASLLSNTRPGAKRVIIAAMRIRKARTSDFPQILDLAQRLNLDYSDMASDNFWVAAEGERVFGICGLKRHPDCSELCALGVEEFRRSQGLGRRLVHAVLRAAQAELYLATVIPGFFARFGFSEAERIPASMIKKADWCAGCRRELCRIMVHKAR